MPSLGLISGQGVGIIDAIKTSILVNVQNNRLQFCVTNTGVKIAPGEQEQTFQPFYRIPRSNLWNYQGIELGLSLVKRLLLRLEGEYASGKWRWRNSISGYLAVAGVGRGRWVRTLAWGYRFAMKSSAKNTVENSIVNLCQTRALSL